MAQQPTHRCFAHIDLDAFYAQVEALRDPARLAGKPCAVVQYNPYGDLKSLGPDDDRLLCNSNGSLIAVSYEARAAGVKRNMRGDAARALCPDLLLVQVPTAHGKADLTLYRDAGKRVLDILARRAKCERASIDECYLDLTGEVQKVLSAADSMPPLPLNLEQVHVMGGGGRLDNAAWWQRAMDGSWGEGELLLACGAVVVSELRHAVRQELGYTCSAGVAHTKLMSKLASGLHKPAQQTLVPAAAVPDLLGPLPISKLRQLGGKFGERVACELSVQTVGELAAVPLATLQQLYGEKDGTWLHALARGVDDGEVTERRLPKSLSCGKTFRGNHALQDMDAVARWLLELAGELEERLVADQQENNRTAQLLTVTFSSQPPWAAAAGGQAGGSKPSGTQSSVSRSCVLRRVQASAMADDVAALIRRWAKEHGAGWSIGSMFLAASNFQPTADPASAITNFFKAAPAGGGIGARQAGKSEPPDGGPSRAGAAARQGLQQQQQPQQLPQQEAGLVEGWGSASACRVAPIDGAGAGAIPSEHATDARAAQPGSAGSAAPGDMAMHASSAAAGHELHATAGDPASEEPSGSGKRRAADASAPAAERGSGGGGQGTVEGVDLEVLAELPASIQREIRAQLKAQQMTQHLKHGPSSNGGGGQAPPSQHTRGGTGGSKRQKSAGRGIGAFFRKP